MLLVLILAATIRSWGRAPRYPDGFEIFGSKGAPATGTKRGTVWTGVFVTVMLALVFAVAVPAGSGVRALNQNAIRSRAAPLTRHDPAKTGQT